MQLPVCPVCVLLWDVDDFGKKLAYYNFPNRGVLLDFTNTEFYKSAVRVLWHRRVPMTASALSQ